MLDLGGPVSHGKGLFSALCLQVLWRASLGLHGGYKLACIFELAEGVFEEHVALFSVRCPTRDS